MRYRVPSKAPRTSRRRPSGPLFLVPTLLALLLAGCGTTTVQVTGGDFPKPIVPSMPLTLGVHFSEQFRSYRLQESVPQRGDWSIDIGNAQVSMLRAVLPAMFDQVVEVDSLEPETLPQGLNAILVPSVQEMQFAIPFQTRSNFFEVWIRYEMSLIDQRGDVIARWPVTAYGKTRSLMLETAEAAMRDAAINALRDAGAFLAIGFPNQQELRPWLERELAALDFTP
ncbi:MAG: hypothetical protein JJT88_11965 [Gammaproteobacteria bacterium]|nr:hypothetical protein [Gammaproteobacteria bacterium]